MVYFKIENTTNLVWEISGSSFGELTGSNCYEISSSEFYSEATPAGYLECSGNQILVYSGSPDVSSVNELDFLEELYQNNIIDFKKYRTRLKIYAFVNNFDSLSLDEQEICSEAFAVSKTDRNKVHTDGEQIELGRNFHWNSVQSRKSRADAAVAVLYNDLEISDAKQVVSDVVHGISGSDDNLVWKYEIFGIEGTLEGDADGLFDYIESRTGSAYSGSGLLDKNYTLTVSRSMQELISEIMDILKNGNYSLDS